MQRVAVHQEAEHLLGHLGDVVGVQPGHRHGALDEREQLRALAGAHVVQERRYAQVGSREVHCRRGVAGGEGSAGEGSVW